MDLTAFFKQLDDMGQDDAATPLERLLLYALVRNVKPKVCIEIGTHRGLSTIAIAKALKDNGGGVVHTIDPKNWGHYFDSFGLQDYVIYHETESRRYTPPECDFIFFDGLHEYEEIQAEMDLYLPKLSQYGVAVFHDAAGDGPTVGTNKALIDYGLESAWIPTGNCLRIYGKCKTPDIGYLSINKARADEGHPRVSPSPDV